MLRSWTPRILLIFALASTSSAFAQAPDAGAPAEEAKKERPRLIKTDGKHEDNEQLGGEPSLTETKQEPAAQVEGEGSPAEDCDLDCLEARLDKEQADEQEKKGTLQVAEETGSLLSGKWADITCMDLRYLQSQPIYDPIAQIVYAAGREQVTDVWVAGRQLVSGGVLTRVDEIELMERVDTWRTKLAGQSE